MDAAGGLREDRQVGNGPNGEGSVSLAQGPRTDVRIVILDDGRVVFGDLTPDLAEVARTLQGGISASVGEASEATQ
ncbi:MAG: hypothetical protein EXR79_03430 [Myxococcales bacterium]|nr:hypothetical protein [Myxococcales bacterium]